jgi:hypothetical protein
MLKKHNNNLARKSEIGSHIPASPLLDEYHFSMNFTPLLYALAV